MMMTLQNALLQQLASLTTSAFCFWTNSAVNGVDLPGNIQHLAETNSGGMERFYSYNKPGDRLDWSQGAPGGFLVQLSIVPLTKNGWWKADKKTFFTSCNKGDEIYKEANALKRTLLKKNQEISNADPAKAEQLRRAVREGIAAEDAERFIIINGIDVNGADDGQWTLLHTAAFGGHADMAKMLLHYGARVDPRTNQDFTPLHLASSRGHLEVCSILLEAGADVNAMTSENFTPLHQAANKNWTDIIYLLIDAGANEDLETLSGWKAEDLLRLRNAN